MRKGFKNIPIFLVLFMIGWVIGDITRPAKSTSKSDQKAAGNIVIFDDKEIKMEKTQTGLFIINKTPCTKILKISTRYKKKQYILQYILKPNKKYNVDIYVKVSKIWVDDIKTTIPEYLEI